MIRQTLLIAFIVLFTLSLNAQDDTLIGPDSYPEGINPLTGLPVDDPDLLDRRPLLVKVSNFPPVVRPQTGLNSADIVWEHLLAGGVTRFSAIFYGSDLEKVGPVRSARLVDMELIRIHNALFAYSGMAQGAIDIMNRDALVSSRAVGGDGPCPALCRYPEEGLALEHTLFADTAALHEEAESRDRDTMPEPVTGMAFRKTPPEGGVPLTGVTVHYRETDSQWTYDPESGRWLRSQDGEPHFDALDDNRVSAANVLILEEEHVVQPFVRDQYWGPPNFAFSVNFIGSGRAFLLRDGRLYEGQWLRESQDGPLEFADLEGNVLPFKPGNTFINLVPRWIDGYYLTFFLEDAAEVSITGDIGVNLRTGPGEAYRTPDVAYPGDTFQAVGRNRSADWVQLLGFNEQETLWVPLSTLDVGDLDVESLPVSRPIVER